MIHGSGIECKNDNVQIKTVMTYFNEDKEMYFLIHVVYKKKGKDTCH